MQRTRPRFTTLFLTEALEARIQMEYFNPLYIELQHFIECEPKNPIKPMKELLKDLKKDIKLFHSTFEVLQQPKPEQQLKKILKDFESPSPEEIIEQMMKELFCF